MHAGSVPGALRVDGQGWSVVVVVRGLPNPAEAAAGRIPRAPYVTG
jgi:hypothetical protein